MPSASSKMPTRRLRKKFLAARSRIVRKRDDASELSLEALAPVVIGVLISLNPAPARHGQQVLLDRDVEILHIVANAADERFRKLDGGLSCLSLRW